MSRTASDATQAFFATCPRGLEGVLETELGKLGATSLRQTPGGVEFRGPYALCYAVNLESRIASRVLWRLKHGRYRNEEDVYQAAHALPWPDWFDVGCTIRVYVTAIKSPLKSLDFVTLRIKDAVCDRFRAACGARPSVDTVTPDMRIHAFLSHEEFTLYLDTSGDSLFKRGLRKSAGEAPLRENLAAGILHLAGWQPGTPLLDPMCGSGTFLMEAAQMALDIAPGLQRHFAFEKLRNFDAAHWQNLLHAAEARRKPVAALPIYGSDLYGDELKNARTNLAEAGLAEAVHLKQANVLEISAPAEHGTLVTNPPYGVRLGEQEELATLYPQLGDVLKKKFAGWNAYILSADMRLPKLIKLTASRRTPLFNGALECRLFEYKMVAGSLRREKPAAQ
ncbi:MAG: THUMP domain-containing protein [Pseudomonadota bacterium]